jgi:membrane associated rhomboid family serine protease
VIPLRDVNPTRRTPIVTIGLIAACFIAFAWEMGVLASAGQEGLEQFFMEHGVVPARVVDAIARRDFASESVVDLVTSQFLHVGWIHLLANLLYLWIFGNNVEDRFGRLAFLAFYLVGGVVAALTHVAIGQSSDLPLVGASGAIAATLGAYVVLHPRARVLSLVFLGFFYQLVQVPALLVLGFWFVLQLLDGVASLGASSAADTNIAFFAHIGGFAFGALFAVLHRTLRRRPLPAATVG